MDAWSPAPPRQRAGRIRDGRVYRTPVMRGAPTTGNVVARDARRLNESPGSERGVGVRLVCQTRLPAVIEVDIAAAPPLTIAVCVVKAFRTRSGLR